jgi:hypothetical protein
MKEDEPEQEPEAKPEKPERKPKPEPNPKLVKLRAELEHLEQVSMRTQQRIAVDRAEFREQLTRSKEIVKEIEAIDVIEQAEAIEQAEEQGPSGQEQETK